MTRPIRSVSLLLSLLVAACGGEATLDQAPTGELSTPDESEDPELGDKADGLTLAGWHFELGIGLAPFPYAKQLDGGVATRRVTRVDLSAMGMHPSQFNELASQHKVAYGILGTDGTLYVRNLWVNARGLAIGEWMRVTNPTGCLRCSLPVTILHNNLTLPMSVPFSVGLGRAVIARGVVSMTATGRALTSTTVWTPVTADSCRFREPAKCELDTRCRLTEVTSATPFCRAR